MRTIELDELVERLKRGDVRLVEALGPAFFQDAHLPGAVNIPVDLVDSLAPALLADRGRPVVVYCSDVDCPNSERVARRLVELGWSTVLVFRGGKQAWVTAGRQVESRR